MAKKKGKSGAKVCPTTCGPTCIFMGLLSAAAAAGGLWLLVGGIVAQTNGFPWTTTLTWYFGGFILWCIAKWFKIKACGCYGN